MKLFEKRLNVAEAVMAMADGKTVRSLDCGTLNRIARDKRGLLASLTRYASKEEWESSNGLYLRVNDVFEVCEDAEGSQ